MTNSGTGPKTGSGGGYGLDYRMVCHKLEGGNNRGNPCPAVLVEGGCEGCHVGAGARGYCGNALEVSERLERVSSPLTTYKGHSSSRIQKRERLG